MINFQVLSNQDRQLTNFIICLPWGVMLESYSFQELRPRVLKLTIALYRVTDYFPKAEILRNHLRTKANEIFEATTEYGCCDTSEQDIKTLIQKVGTIKGYLAIAGTLNYVRPVNLTILEREYDLIEQFLDDQRIKLVSQPVHEDIRDIENSLALDTGKKNKAVLISEHNSSQMSPSSPLWEEDEGIRKGYNGSETEMSRKAFYSLKGVEELNERQKIIVSQMKMTRLAKISDFSATFKDMSSKTIQRDLQYLVDRQILKKVGEKRWTVYSLVEKDSPNPSVLL
ncbi:MAG: hypothetical protein Q8R40_05975 [bacterium]|nr:hypothetical protein [bacterium]